MRKQTATSLVILGVAATVILAMSTANSHETSSMAAPEKTAQSAGDQLREDRTQSDTMTDYARPKRSARNVSTENTGDYDNERPVSASDGDRAARAALDEVGEGRVLDVDRDLEGGATWEVEILLGNGTVVDVLLDDRFRVLNVGDEREAGERPDDSREDRDDRDDDRDDD